MAFTDDKLIRATRVSLAIVISFVYTSYVGVSDPMWVFMSAPMALFDSATLGGSINKAKARFLGTFFSAIFCLIVIEGFANNLVINLIALVIGVFLASYWFMGDPKLEPVGGLITWTLPVLLFNDNDLRSSFLRLFNIATGLFIAFIISRYFFPSYARNGILNCIKNPLSELKKQLVAILDPNVTHEKVVESYLQYEQKIASNTAVYTKLLGEVRTEIPKDVEYINLIVTCYLHLQRTARLMNLMTFHIDALQNINNEYAKLVRSNIDNLQVIIDAIGDTQKNYSIPSQWQNMNDEEFAVDYQQYNVLSGYELNLIIQKEIHFISCNLKKVFEIRRQLKY